MQKKILIDLTGKRIDFLTVIKWHGSGGKKCNTEWLCECACGLVCVKSRSFLTSKTANKKNCGACIDGNPVIEKTFNTFKIVKLEEGKRQGINSRFYIGECIICGHIKKISKMTIQSFNSQLQNRKRNLTCPACLINSRRGGGLAVGDQKDFLRICEPLGTKGRGTVAKYYWKVECLFKGMGCKQYVEYTSGDYRRNSSCGCKWAKDRRLVDGMSRKDHPYYKIYQLRKNCYDKCHVKGHKNYETYGARGIYVCDEWKPAAGEMGRKNLFKFLEWCLENGWEEGLHLDRIDNDGPYAPWNCQFIPAIENIFYASIDNANISSLKTYVKFYEVWSNSIELLKVNGQNIEDFSKMVNRWRKRIEMRAEKLGVSNIYEI